MAEVAERATDPGTAPARVLGGELDDQALQRSDRAGPAALSLGSAIVLLGDELAVPAQDRIGGHQAAELVQDAAAERSALRRKPAALVIGEPQATVAELLAQTTRFSSWRYSTTSRWRRFTQPANTSTNTVRSALGGRVTESSADTTIMPGDKSTRRSAQQPQKEITHIGIGTRVSD